MKSVYKSIDSSKINNTNLNSILEQFKKHSIIESINELNKNNIKLVCLLTSLLTIVGSNYDDDIYCMYCIWKVILKYICYPFQMINNDVSMMRRLKIKKTLKMKMFLFFPLIDANIPN